MRMDYSKAKLGSQSMLEQDDCAVIAASIAMNRSYHWAHAEFEKLGRVRGRPTMLDISTKVMLGTKDFAGLVKKGVIKLTVEEFGRKVTPRTLAKKLGKGRWIAVTRKHMLAIVDGEVQDYTATTNHRVLMFWQMK